MADDLKPWGPEEKEAWLGRQTIQRSYQDDVVTRINALPTDQFVIEQYGALSRDPERYPLFCVKSKDWTEGAPVVVVTGGVHGYEDSGVTGCLRFMEEEAPTYAGKVNFVFFPCVSPFAYEINHRWNAKAEDPNRHFHDKGTAEEAKFLMAKVKSLKLHFNAAVDLHETNNRDIGLTAERRARDGQKFEEGDDYIPEGYYLVLPSKADLPLAHKVIEEVRKVTPICADASILGYPADNGIIVLDDLKTLCQDFMRQHADVGMTTEIYPEKCTRDECERAQMATIRVAAKSVLGK
jgi:hypothetical protein